MLDLPLFIDTGEWKFVGHVIAMQEEYYREQIPWQDIPFSDNQPCIDLIAAKPHGILRILDDQSCFPQVSHVVKVNHQDDNSLCFPH